MDTTVITVPRKASASPGDLKSALGLGLWGLLWLSLGTEPERILNPQGFADLLHGVRAILPFLAASLAVLAILIRGDISRLVFGGPLGLLWIYGGVGIIASLFISPEPMVSLYWAGAYLSVLFVLGALLWRRETLARIREVIRINWLLMIILTVLAFVFLILFGGASLFSFQRVEPVNILPTILGAVTPRSTGIARYAAVAGILALNNLSAGKKSRRWVWIAVFVLSQGVLYLSQSKAATLGFVVGSLVVIALYRRWILVVAIVPLLLQLTLTYNPVIILLPGDDEITAGDTEITTGDTSELFALTGRTRIWQEGWRLFLASPLLGFGFHADRIILGKHMHNAILHALVQTGLIGTLPFVLAILGTWVALLRLLRSNPALPATERPFLVEVCGVLAFLSVRGVAESTGAFFGVDWLLLAPLLTYIQATYMINRRG